MRRAPRRRRVRLQSHGPASVSLCRCVRLCYSPQRHETLTAVSAAAQDLHAWSAAKQPSFWELLASSVPAVWGSLPRCATTYMICSCRYFSIVLWCPLTRRTGGRVVTDGNSGFFTTYDNVVADSPGALWLSVNSCKPPPNRIFPKMTRDQIASAVSSLLRPGGRLERYSGACGWLEGLPPEWVYLRPLFFNVFFIFSFFFYFFFCFFTIPGIFFTCHSTKISVQHFHSHDWKSVPFF